MIYDDGSVPAPNDDASDLEKRVAAELKAGKAERDIILDLIRDGSVNIVPEADELIAKAKALNAPNTRQSGRSSSTAGQYGSTQPQPTGRSGNRLRYLIGIVGTLAIMAALYIFGGSHGTSLIIFPLFIGLRFFGMSNRGGGRGGGGGGPWTVKMPPSSPPQQTTSLPPPAPDQPEPLEEPHETPA